MKTFSQYITITIISVVLVCGAISCHIAYTKSQLIRDQEIIKSQVEKLAYREQKLTQVVSNYEAKRDLIRDEIQRLTAQKILLEEVPTNSVAPKSITTNMPTVIVTNIMSPVEYIMDGRLTARMRIEEEFNTREIYVMPYSPHEFIFRSNNHVYYAYCSGNSTNAEVYFRIFE